MKAISSRSMLRGIGLQASPTVGILLAIPRGRWLRRAATSGLRSVDVVTAVDALVEALQVVEVGREQALDDAGVDGRQVAEPRDHPGQHDDRQVGLVLLYTRVAQRQDLVGRGREPHDAARVQDAGRVEVAFRQV